MFLATLAVALLVFYWFGTRPALVAAVATLAVVLAGALFPALTWWLHGALAVAVGAVCFVGPRRANPAHAARVTRSARRALAIVRKGLGL
jgi:hypothetical protein